MQIAEKVGEAPFCRAGPRTTLCARVGGGYIYRPMTSAERAPARSQSSPALHRIYGERRKQRRETERRCGSYHIARLKVFGPLGPLHLAQVCFLGQQNHHGGSVFRAAMGCGASGKVAPLELDTQQLTPVVRDHSISKKPGKCSVVVGRAPTAEVECDFEEGLAIFSSWKALRSRGHGREEHQSHVHNLDEFLSSVQLDQDAFERKFEEEQFQVEKPRPSREAGSSSAA
eukprot:s101_g27.t1